MGLAEQRVLVTGGSRGIGRAIALLFAQRGAVVAAQFRADEAVAAGVVAELGGIPHVALRADVSDPAQVQSLVEGAVEALGGVDVLVNNAGIYEGHPVLSTSYEDWQASWQRTIATNLLGPANLMHAVVPHMVEAGGGRIVNVLLASV